MNSLKTIIKEYENILCENNIENSKYLMEIIICEVLGMNRNEIYINLDKKINNQANKKIEAHIKRIIKGEPIQYILGYTYFYGYKIYCNKNVLIPRPETEILVHETIKYANKINIKNPNILDLCTGSGCISIALSKEIPSAEIDALDISKYACQLIEKNINSSNIFNIEIIHEDLHKFKTEKNKYDIIVSNPPYIPTGVLKHISKKVINNEPFLALDGGRNGLMFLEAILNIAKNSLKNNGLLIIELHESKLNEAKYIASKYQFKEINIIKDLNKKDRFLKIIR